MLRQFKGRPLRYLLNHDKRTSPVEYVEEDRGYATPCWIWQRAFYLNGYGKASGQPKSATRLAHRVYYQRVQGAIPDGLEIDHLCRQKACVNPDHLEAVSHAVNVRRSANSKLTEDDVIWIRNLYAAGVRQFELALRFGVSTKSIGAVVNNRVWVLDGN